MMMVSAAFRAHAGKAHQGSIRGGEIHEGLPHLQRAAATRLRTVAFVQQCRARVIKSSDFVFREAGNPNYFAIFCDF